MTKFVNIIPIQLHRYRPLPDDAHLKQELKALNEDYVWSSSYNNLNDPMEGSFSPSKLASLSALYPAATKKLDHRKSQIKLCSFAASARIDLMWAHYTGHKGICVSFSVERLLASFDDTVSIAKVSYAEQPIMLYKTDLIVTPATILKTLSQKKTSWAYEQEWRLMTKSANSELRYAKNCIRTIFFAMKIRKEHKEAIFEFAKSRNIRTYDVGIRNYEMIAHEYPPKRKKSVAAAI